MPDGEPQRPVGMSADDALTRSRWDDLWNAFDERDVDPHHNPQLRDSLDLIRRFWPSPREGGFLEAGCGPAANSLQLAKEGVSVTGVDYTDGAVEFARELFALRGNAPRLRGRSAPCLERRMTGGPEWSVVVPTRDRPRELEACLARLAPGAQTLEAQRYEVIVTDDGDFEATDVWLRTALEPRR